MKFRAQVSNHNLLLRVIQTIDRLNKTAILRLTPQALHLIVLTDHLDTGLQLWSDLQAAALFSEYQIESNNADEIYLEFAIDHLQKALRSCGSSSMGVEMRLTKHHNLPVLALHITQLSAMGRPVSMVQRVPVRLLSKQQMDNVREPNVPESQVHVMLPSLGDIRSVTERIKKMGEGRMMVEANWQGQLRLSSGSDQVRLLTTFEGLENPRYGTDMATPEGFFGAVVETKGLLKFLQSYHVAPRNVVCCVVEQCALVFYVYVGSVVGVEEGRVGETAVGTLTYFLPVLQI